MPKRAEVDPLPAPDELARAPELATLVLLERALEVTRNALIAANPELHACLDESPAGLPWDAQARCASDLVDLADRIRVVLHTYRRLLAEADAVLYGADDFPF
jgi:hypothetical protein